MTYYQPPRAAAAPVFTYAYPQENVSYGYSASPTSPAYPSGNYYPPSSSQKRTSTAAYYPPSSSSAFPVPPPAPRRRSASFSSPAAAAPLVTDPKKKEMLYRHIGPDTSKHSSSSSKPRSFSKTRKDIEYEYLYDDVLYISGDDSTEDDYFWDQNKEKLSQRFQRPGLRRSGTEKLSSGLSTRQPRSPSAEVIGLGLKMPSSPIRERGRERTREREREIPLPSPRAPTRERSSIRTRERSAVRTREMSLPRAPRPPPPQRHTEPPPPPPAPTSNISYGSSSSHERHGGHRQHHLREERTDKAWMNINGNKISVDHKGVKINGQRYELPGGKGTFNVGGIKVRVEGRDISLV